MISIYLLQKILEYSFAVAAVVVGVTFVVVLEYVAVVVIAVVVNNVAVVVIVIVVDVAVVVVDRYGAVAAAVFVAALAGSQRVGLGDFALAFAHLANVHLTTMPLLSQTTITRQCN